MLPPGRRIGNRRCHERRRPAAGPVGHRCRTATCAPVLQTCHRTRRRDHAALNFLLRMYATSLSVRVWDTRPGGIGPGPEPQCKGTSERQVMIAAGRISQAACAVTSGAVSLRCGLPGPRRRQEEPVRIPVGEAAATCSPATHEMSGNALARAHRTFRNLRQDFPTLRLNFREAGERMRNLHVLAGFRGFGAARAEAGTVSGPE